MKRMVLVALSLVFGGAAAGGAEEQPSAALDGRELFVETHKCALCHSVPGAGIEAKTKSDKLKGPDLGGPLPEALDLARVGAYLRKQAKRDGEEHKREFKGSDEELQALVDWLLEQKAEAAKTPGAR